MKCTQCGAEIRDGAKFCQNCGAKQAVQTGEKRFCKSCGAPLKPGVAFCASCGAKVTDGAQKRADTAAGSNMQAAPQRTVWKKNYTPIIIAVVLVLCIGIAAGVALKFTVFSADKSTAEQVSEVPVQQEPEEIKQVESEQIDSSNADLVADGEVSLKGMVKVSTDNRLFLAWDEPMSILLKEDDDEFVRINDVSSAYLENDGVKSSLWSELPLAQQVLVTGELELDGSQLVLQAERLTDLNGDAIVIEAQEAASEEILPQSDTRLLTQQDIAGLSLQQINYAKNEIYARHGRRFTSKELQDYFNAQSWYSGTIDAAKFNESVLSDVEKKNAAYLAEVEFSIAPKGYQLDQ